MGTDNSWKCLLGSVSERPFLFPTQYILTPSIVTSDSFITNVRVLCLVSQSVTYIIHHTCMSLNHFNSQPQQPQKPLFFLTTNLSPVKCNNIFEHKLETSFSLTLSTGDTAHWHTKSVHLPPLNMTFPACAWSACTERGRSAPTYALARGWRSPALCNKRAGPAPWNCLVTYTLMARVLNICKLGMPDRLFGARWRVRGLVLGCKCGKGQIQTKQWLEWVVQRRGDRKANAGSVLWT